MLEEVGYLSLQGSDRADVWVSGFDVGDFFASATVLLVSVSECNGSLTFHVIRRTVGAEVVRGASEVGELDVLEGEGGAVAVVLGGGAEDFAGPVHEELAGSGEEAGGEI